MALGARSSGGNLDPKSRAVAEDLARQSGVSLRQWLDEMMQAEEGPEEAVSQDIFKPRTDATYLETPRAPEQGPGRYEAVSHPADEVGRLAEAMERLTSRIEAAERRSTLAISGVEQSVNGAILRLELAEREQTAVAARFEGALQDFKQEQAPIADRLRRVELEAQGPRSAEALKSLESALGKVASHLYDGEARTRESLEEMRARLERAERERIAEQERLSSLALADEDRKALEAAQASAARAVELVEQEQARIAAAEERAGQAMSLVQDLGAVVRRTATDPQALLERVTTEIDQRLAEAESQTAGALVSLRESFAGLDHRLTAAETHGQPFEQRLEQLASTLSERIDAARSEMSDRLAQTTAGRFDRMEDKLAEMSGHVAAAEKRSAEAIERMGREVLTMAESLSRRITTSEGRSADAIQHMGGEMARIAISVETRLNRADATQAQALEKLGGEIARITERLVERIGNAERRSAQAMDDVGEQVARITERLTQRQERTSSDLLDRIRQSEERTARLLDEAREKIDARLSESQRRIEEAVAPAARAPAPGAFSPFDEPEDPFAPQAFARQAFEAEPPRAFAPISEPVAFAPAAPVFTPPPAEEPVSGFEPDPVFDEAPGGFDADAFEPEPQFDPFEPVSDLAADDDVFEAGAVELPPEFAPPPPPPSALSTRSLVEQARAAARTNVVEEPLDERTAERAARKAAQKNPEASLFAGLRQLRQKKKRPSGSTIQAAVVIAALAAVGGGIFGTLMLDDGDSGAGETQVANAEAPPATPRAAVALDPQPIGPTVPAAAPAAAPSVDPSTAYAAAVAKVEAKDAAGLADLKRIANLGYAPAQFYLAKLYENGEGGVVKDIIEARRWTERAAAGGDRKAMHNLALYYFEGVGGAKNTTQAAQWFRKAADLGLTDSQYNLGRLYEEGFGVSQNAAEAYKWYLIASRSGDGEARASAERAKAKLNPPARAAAERSAAGFRAGPAAAPAAAASAALTSADDLAMAQRALSRLGYYQGPADGKSSPALRLAIGAYQRDQGLPTTGALDAALSGRLAAFSQ